MWNLLSTELNKIAKTSTKNAFFLFLGSTLSTVIMAFASILIARLLGPENYGLYTLAMVLPSFLVPVIDLGISSALTRFCARYYSEGKYRKIVGLINAGIAYKIIFSVMLSLVLLFLADPIAAVFLRRPSLSLFIRFTSFYLIGQAIFPTLNSIFIGLDKTKNLGFLMIIEAVTKLVTSILLIVLGFGIIGAILGAGFGLILAAGIGITILLMRINSSLKRREIGESLDFLQAMRAMIQFGIPLYFSGLLFTFVNYYRSLILAFFVSNVEIANYSVAINFSLIISLITNALSNTIFPAFSKINSKENPEQVKKMFLLAVKYTSLLVVPTSFAVATLSNEIVNILYGIQYASASNYLTIYISNFLFTSLGMIVVESFFNGQGDTKATFKINLINLGVSIPLALVFTSIYGVFGLIVSLIVSQFLSVIYALSLARRKYGMTIDWFFSLKTVVVSFLSAIIVYFFIIFTPVSASIFNLVIGGFLYIVSFLILLPLLEVISKEDIEILDEILKELTLVYPILRWMLNFEKKILSIGHTF